MVLCTHAAQIITQLRIDLMRDGCFIACRRYTLLGGLLAVLRMVMCMQKQRTWEEVHTMKTRDKQNRSYGGRDDDGLIDQRQQTGLLHIYETVELDRQTVLNQVGIYSRHETMEYISFCET